MTAEKPPVVVEKKRSRRGEATARPVMTPDKSIRVFHADAPVRAAPVVKSNDTEIEEYVRRYRGANDQKVLRDAAKRHIGADKADSATASVIPMPHHPLGAGYFVVAGKGCFALLGKALKMIIKASKFVRPDAPKEPGYRDGLTKYVKALKP